MNEEDIKQFKKELWFNKGFQKGKLEAEKRFKKKIKELIDNSIDFRFIKIGAWVNINELKELQKEIGEEKQNE